MMDSFRFVKCPNCGWEKNPRMSCFNCGDKTPATSKTSSDTALAAAEAKLAYFEELAGERLLQITADAERIAELEKALEPFAEAYRHAEKGGATERHPHAFEEFRRAAALLKEKE